MYVLTYFILKDGFGLVRRLNSPLQAVVGRLCVDKAIFQILDPATIRFADVLQTRVFLAKKDELLLRLDKIAAKRFH